MPENIFESNTVIMNNRNSVDISGVQNVISFDDETIFINSILGKISIKGQNLSISNFNNETGDFKANGKIHGVIYLSDSKEDGGFFAKLFK